uniref:Nuclear pore complex protein Nup98-Nup96 n=1 Tax=Panagrolaimus sp. PS1159 TaxID=55785 RepID=A0AC35FWM7_9BILA
PAGTGLFGSTASTFGQQQQPSTGSNLFGGTNTGTTGSLFGSAAKPAGLFGSNTTSTFGQQQQPSTGSNLFGGTNTSTTGSLFGSTAKPAGLFGSNTTATFGQQQQQPTQQFATAPTSAPVQPIYLGGKDDENAIKRAILESQLSSLPYGDSPFFKNKSALPGISSSSVLSRNNESSNIQSQLRKLANQALSPTSSPSNNTSSNGNTSALNNLSNGSTILSPNASFSYKPLVGLPSLGFDPGRNQSSLNLSLRSSPQKLSKNNSFMSDSKKQHQSLKSFDVSVLKSTKSNASKPSSTVSTPPTADAEILTPQQSRRRSVCFADVPNLTQVRTTDSTTIVTESATTTDAALLVTVPKKSILVTPETRRPREVTAQSPITPPTFSETTTSDSVDMNNSSALNSSILLAEGYYVEPPIEELENSLKDGKYFVHGGLTVGRNGYGSVFWPGDFELSSLNFEDIISFRSKEVVVYPDDESKPPLGVDLNRPAEVSLERVWPFDKETKEYIKDPTTLGKLQFRARLERACNRMDARFIDYQVTTGTWTFGVSHFSKYGLVDDEDDDPMMTVEQMQALQRQKNQMSKIQRLPLEKKSFPLREIQSDYSFAASGLGGGFVDPMIKYEGKTFGVTLNDDLDDEPRDFKRIRLDHDMTSELLESKPSFAELVIPTFSRQKLVPRECDEKILEVSKNKLLRLRYQNVRSRAEALYLKTVRPQWHPSEPMTILSQSETNCFVTKKITAVPLLKTYFENYLESDGRIEELPKILQSPALNFNPPSVLIDLLDAHILSLKRDSTIADDEAEKQIKSLCAAILLSPSAPNYGIQQRRRLGDWIRKMLAPSLKIILKNVSDDDENLATRVIYECLVHGNVKEAAAQAIRFKYFNLALFISLHNCSTSNDCKEAFALQYSEADRIFQNGNKDKYMMSIYQMFGGPKNLKAALSDPHSVLCFNGLSWLQIFGIFIWYGTSPADTLADLY